MYKVGRKRESKSERGREAYNYNKGGVEEGTWKDGQDGR
jgi:hypothetical protein